MADFANRFYAQSNARSNPQENFAISPLAVYQTLSLARSAAAGRTEAQINQILGLPELTAKVSAEEISKVSYRTIDSANDIWTDLITGSTLDFVTPLFVSKPYPLTPRFSDKGDWNAGRRIHPIDFRFRPKRARKKINRWIKKNSSGQLPGAIPEALISPSTRALLISAIWYKVAWPLRFDEKLTRKRPFLLENGRKKMVSTMQVQASFRVLDAGNQGYRAINLPFQQKVLSITFILPNPKTDIHAVEASLDFDEIDKAIDGRPMVETKLTLPRFEIRAAKSLSLREVLGEMGMRDAFDSKKADFFRLTPSEKPIAIQDIIHDAKIIVDENADLDANAPKTDRDQALRFNLDRPFLFFVRHKSLRTILFAGRVMNPYAPKKPRGDKKARRGKRAKRAKRTKPHKRGLGLKK